MSVGPSPVFLFVMVTASLGVILGLCATAGRYRIHMFKQQGVAWVITIVMVFAAIGIGYAKAPAYNHPAPEPYYPSETIPPAAISSYVRDDADVLSDEEIQVLNARNQRLTGRYGVAIGVVTCNYGGDDLYSYAMQCAEDMGLGGYDMIVALDIEGDNYWLIQGDKLTRDFTDDDCSNYAYDYMEKDFAKGNYDQAVLNLTEMLELWYDAYYG